MEADIDMPGPGSSVNRNGPADWNGSPSDSKNPSPHISAEANKRVDEKKKIERQMLTRNKSHIKHTFRDFDMKGQPTCKFVCTTYWATQFQAVRKVFLSQNGSTSSGLDAEESFVESLSSAYSWAASGGKSGASFARTSDDRFVIKCISRTELQMFLDCAPAYFEYLSKAFFHGL
jgi:1-phosphatidylinositol-3-phosphate 5-kinase